MSLEILESLGYMEEMADNYCNLGREYRDRGHLDRAEEMYLKSIDLFRNIRRVV